MCARTETQPAPRAVRRVRVSASDVEPDFTAFLPRAAVMDHLRRARACGRSRALMSACAGARWPFYHYCRSLSSSSFSPSSSSSSCLWHPHPFHSAGAVIHAVSRRGRDGNNSDWPALLYMHLHTVTDGPCRGEGKLLCPPPHARLPHLGAWR